MMPACAPVLRKSSAATRNPPASARSLRRRRAGPPARAAPAGRAHGHQPPRHERRRLRRPPRRALPDVHIIMLTVYDDTDVIFQSLAAGAGGYLLKPVRRPPNCSKPSATSSAAERRCPPPSPVASSRHSANPRPAAGTDGAGEMALLSPREREILELLAQGLLLKEIADNFGVRPRDHPDPHRPDLQKAARPLPRPGRRPPERPLSLLPRSATRGPSASPCPPHPVPFDPWGSRLRLGSPRGKGYLRVAHFFGMDKRMFQLPVQ